MLTFPSKPDENKYSVISSEDTVFRTRNPGHKQQMVLVCLAAEFL